MTFLAEAGPATPFPPTRLTTMYIIAMRLGFWIVAGCAVAGGERRKVPVVLIALWLLAFGAARLFPALETASVIVHAVLLVAIGLWITLAHDV